MKVLVTIVLLLTYVIHAETTGSINIGQPEIPLMSSPSDVNFTNTNATEPKNSYDSIILLLFIVVILLAAGTAFLIRRHR